MPNAGPALLIVSPEGNERRTTLADVVSQPFDGISDEEKIVILPAGVEVASASTFMDPSATSANAELWPLANETDWRDDWSALPASVAARMRRPLDAVLVVPAAAMANVTDFHGAPSLWSLLIDLADAGQLIRIASMPAATTHRLCWSPSRLVPKHDLDELDELRNRIMSCPALKSAASSVGAASLAAGLLQIHDDLHGSHEQSQSIEGAGPYQTGDYWHGITHRREPDYGNSKYWFRRVGDHPVFPQLAVRAERILSHCDDDRSPHWQSRLISDGRWDPLAFVELCEACNDDETSRLGLAARDVQWAEMRLLLHHSYAESIA